MKKKHRDLDKPTTLRDLDDLAAQVITAVSKETSRIEEKVDKLDQKVNTIEKKVNTIEKKVDKLDYNVSDIRRRVIDLEVTDAPTRAEFNALKHQLATHTR